MPSNILVNEFLFPKITGLDYIKKITDNPIIRNIDNCSSGNAYYQDIYNAPEIMKYDHYSSSSDVYAFAMIIYNIITNEKPFSNISSKDIYDLVCNHKARPEIKESVSVFYRNLIQRCWAQDPKERPSFDEIIYHMKTNPEFANNEEFQAYVRLIDKGQNSNDSKQLNDFVNSKNHLFRKVKIDFEKLNNKRKFFFNVNMGTIDFNKFSKESKLGSGSFGVVYKVTNKETNELGAAKVSIYEMDRCTEDIILNLSREIYIISSLNHPSILRFIGYSPVNFKNKPKPVIITEYAPNNSLEQIIELERKGISNYDWNDTKKLINIYGIAAGMSYLHDNNILHRDL